MGTLNYYTKFTAQCIKFLATLIGGLQAIPRFSEEHKTKQTVKTYDYMHFASAKCI